MKRASIALVALAVLAVSCSSSPSGTGDDLARLVPLAGDVKVLSAGQEILAAEEIRLGAGDVVSTGARGVARLILPGDQSLELGPLTKTRLQPGPAPRLLQGNVLAIADEGLTVLAGDERVDAEDAVFRVQRRFSTTVGVYQTAPQGSVRVVGVAQPIPALRRLTIISAGTLPQGVQPLRVTPGDPWDDRFLGPAIDVGLGIDRLERGLAAQLSGPRGLAVVANLLDESFPNALVRSLLDSIDPSQLADVVLASRLAARAAELRGAAAASVLDQIVQLRGQGAQWIVIVAEWRLFSERLLDGLARLSGLIARAVAPPPAGGGNTSGSGPGGAPPTGTGPGAPGGGGGPGGDNGGNGGNNNGGNDPPPPPPPPPDCQNAVECVVEDILETADGL